jgi:hypothetical protein
MLAVEDELVRHALPVSGTDLFDGSVGRCYRGHRQGQVWAGVSWQDVPLNLPSRAAPVFPHIYPREELHFEGWLEDVYLPEHLPDYLRRKFRDRFGDRPLLAAGDACRRLTGRPLHGRQPLPGPGPAALSLTAQPRGCAPLPPPITCCRCEVPDADGQSF